MIKASINLLELLNNEFWFSIFPGGRENFLFKTKNEFLNNYWKWEYNSLEAFAQFNVVYASGKESGFSFRFSAFTWLLPFFSYIFFWLTYTIFCLSKFSWQSWEISTNITFANKEINIIRQSNFFTSLKFFKETGNFIN